MAPTKGKIRECLLDGFGTYINSTAAPIQCIERSQQAQGNQRRGRPIKASNAVVRNLIDLNFHRAWF